MFQPKWAIRAATGFEKGAQLCTKDGRRIGNGVVSGNKISRLGYLMWPVLTDAGHILYMSDAELEDMFHPPQWVMDVQTAPGQASLKWVDSNPFSEEHRQIINALNRAMEDNIQLAKKLVSAHDYRASIPEADAEYIQKAINLLLQVR